MEMNAGSQQIASATEEQSAAFRANCCKYSTIRGNGQRIRRNCFTLYSLVNVCKNSGLGHCFYMVFTRKFLQNLAGD